ncbi:MAG: hypothetical protein IH914_00295 [candidate division Zixibacteria bacterium]|nr:hypothetical protein [candidate division Zixibacteria bacterium]
MPIRYSIFLIAAFLVSCTSYVATFYSVEEGEVNENTSFYGEHIITRSMDVELKLYVEKSKGDLELHEFKTENSMSDTFQLVFTASPVDSVPWPIDSISVAGVSLISEEPLLLDMTLTPKSTEFSSNWWYQTFELFSIPKETSRLRLIFELTIYTGSTAQEETLSVKLYRKDVVWTGPPRGLFH